MWSYPKILAHRGGGALAPENTIAALRCGLAHGFRAVEFDVMLSRDEVPVLMHDPEFGRTVAGQGAVAQTMAAQLQSMDAGSWFGPVFAGETVPAFAQVLQFCLDNRIWMNVEIKPAPEFEARTGQVVAEHCAAFFASLPKASWPLLSSFSEVALAAAAKAAPDMPRALLIDHADPTPDASGQADWLGRVRVLGAIALHTNQKHTTPQLVQAVHAAGLGMFCYTVNTPERARQLLEWGVDAFCTDRIDLIGPGFV